jgi:hypothetical protein
VAAATCACGSEAASCRKGAAASRGPDRLCDSSVGCCTTAGILHITNASMSLSVPASPAYHEEALPHVLCGSICCEDAPTPMDLVAPWRVGCCSQDDDVVAHLSIIEAEQELTPAPLAWPSNAAAEPLGRGQRL